ncbi:hypothetical protein GGI07_000114 [Coemansia sp. Benny D115]|nr:hypothetical protein GGI07_000114 [Coemansia sp. Benny D115]
MLSSGLVEFLLYLLVPLIIINFLRGRNSKDSSLARKNRFSQIDIITYTSLAVLAAFYMYSAMYSQPPNVFKRLGMHHQAPCHTMRKRLSHVATRRPHIVPAGGIPTDLEKANKDFDRLAYYQGSEYGRMDFLIDRFCLYDEDRSVYLKYGESVFLESISSDFGPRGTTSRISPSVTGMMAQWSDVGFVLHSMSSQIMTYMPAFVLVGLITTPFAVTEFAPSRMNVRPWCVITLSTLLAADLFWMFTVPTDTKMRVERTSTLWIISPDSTSAVVFFADSAAYTRRVFLAISMLAFVAMDFLTSSRQTDVQVLKHCIAKQEETLRNAKNHTMLETAVMMSTPLRDRSVALWRREQNVREQVFADESFKATYATVSAETKSTSWARKTIPKVLAAFGAFEKS